MRTTKLYILVSTMLLPMLAAYLWLSDVGAQLCSGLSEKQLQGVSPGKKVKWEAWKEWNETKQREAAKAVCYHFVH